MICHTLSLLSHILCRLCYVMFWHIMFSSRVLSLSSYDPVHHVTKLFPAKPFAALENVIANLIIRRSSLTFDTFKLNCSWSVNHWRFHRKRKCWRHWSLRTLQARTLRLLRMALRQTLSYRPLRPLWRVSRTGRWRIKRLQTPKYRWSRVRVRLLFTTPLHPAIHSLMEW